MKRYEDPRFVLVTRNTRLQELIERFNTWPQAKFYLEHNGVETGDYLAEHDLYKERLVVAEQLLSSMGPLQQLERALLPNYTFGDNDIVVVIGQDGLVANTLKYLEGQPVIAVNPDPGRWDGKLLPFKINDLEKVVGDTVAGHSRSHQITFAEANSNCGQRMRAVNDLFIGPRTHTSLRYSLTWDKQYEIQSSSGIIVSTGFGSTGWFQSILAGALGVTGTHFHDLIDGFAWDARRLQFTVREPFPSQITGTNLVFGQIDMEKPLVLESHTPENGVIFSDGMEEDYIRFNSGMVLTVGVSEVQGRLIC